MVAWADSWVDFMCCSVVMEPYDELRLALFVWKRMCSLHGATVATALASSELGALQHKKLSAVLAHCPSDIPAGQLGTGLAQSFLTVINHRNERIETVAAPTNCSIGQPAAPPPRRTGSLLVMLHGEISERLKDSDGCIILQAQAGHVSVLIVPDEEQITPFPPQGKVTPRYISFAASNEGSVAEALTALTAEHRPWGADAGSVTRIFALPGADVAAAMLAAEEVQNATRFDVLQRNCAWAVLHILQAGFHDVCHYGQFPQIVAPATLLESLGAYDAVKSWGPSGTVIPTVEQVRAQQIVQTDSGEGIPDWLLPTLAAVVLVLTLGVHTYTKWSEKRRHRLALQRLRSGMIEALMEQSDIAGKVMTDYGGDDGEVDLDEFRFIIKSLVGEQRAARPTDLFNTADADGNGRIDRDEMRKFLFDGLPHATAVAHPRDAPHQFLAVSDV